MRRAILEAMGIAGDVGVRNAGLLIFIDGREPPEYAPWADVEQVDFDRPPAMSRGSAGAHSGDLSDVLASGIHRAPVEVVDAAV